VKIKLGLLTPLWTGSVETGKMDRTHEVGIVGGLRWWYEAIVHGLGGAGHQPAGADHCEYNPRLPAPPEEQLCPVCYLFGATGWRRRVRIEADEGLLAPAAGIQQLNVRPGLHAHGWFVPLGKIGELDLRLDGDAAAIDRLAALVLFLEKWGTLGAKPQFGCGRFEILNRAEVCSYAARAPWAAMGANGVSGALDVRAMGFFRYDFAPAAGPWWRHLSGLDRLMTNVETRPVLTGLAARGIVPVGPLLKDEWRYRGGAWRGNVVLCLFGTSGANNDRVRSKVAVGWARDIGDRWEVPGWVWLPPVDDRGARFLSAELGQVWTLVRDATRWDRVLKAAGAVTTEPPRAAWVSRTTTDVIAQLEATRV